MVVCSPQRQPVGHAATTRATYARYMKADDVPAEEA